MTQADTANSIADTFAQADERTRRRLVYLAIGDAKGSRGGKSGAWKASEGVLFDTACAIIVDNTSVATAFSAHSAAFAKAGVSDRSITRWSKQVREAYNERLVRYVGKQAALLDAHAADGDMMALSKMLLTTLGAECHALVSAGGMNDLAKDVRSAVVRITECIIDAAKVDAEQSLKRAQTDQLRLKLDALAAQAERSGAKVDARDIFKMFDALMRGNAPDSLDQLRARMAEQEAA